MLVVLVIRILWRGHSIHGTREHNDFYGLLKSAAVQLLEGQETFLWNQAQNPHYIWSGL